jgi:hypothetical protein
MARSNTIDDKNDPAGQLADTGNDEAADSAIVLSVFVVMIARGPYTNQPTANSDEDEADGNHGYREPF